MMRRQLRGALALLVPLALGVFALAGCSGSDDDDSSQATSPTPTPQSSEAPAPSIAITAPAAGDVEATFTVTVDVQNFNLVDKAGGTNAQGEGHWHLFVDGVYRNYAVTNTMEVSDLPGGPHTLKAELVNNDHSELSPPVFSNEVTINSPAPIPVPTITIVSPSDGSTQEGTFDLEVDVQDFVLSDDVGGENVDGEGHYHLYINDEYKGTGTDTVYHINGLADGAYMIKVVLAENDHTPLTEPSATDTIEITVHNTKPATPSINISYPGDSALVNASSTKLEVDVQNFTLDPEHVGGTNVSGTGHYHIFVDGVYQSYSASSSTVVTDLHPGTHDIKVELVNNDHSSLNPPVTDAVLVKVGTSAPQVYIDSPAGGSTLHSHSVELELSWQNFIMDPNAIGGKPAPGKGHYHVLVDGEYYDYGTSDVALVSDLSEGTHLLTVELVNNDHSELDQPVVDNVLVTVAAGSPGISITSPDKQDTELASNTVELSLDVVNFTLDPGSVGQANQAGHGHYHVYLDGEYYAYDADLTTLVSGLDAGSHTIGVELVNNDHTSLAEKVEDYVRVIVPDDVPTVSIVSPDGSAAVNSTSPTIEVAVSNFTLDPANIGSSQNVAGTGHYHLYLDGEYLLASGDPQVILPDIGFGTHTVQVVLAENDHTELSPLVADEVTFTVAEAAPSISILTPTPGTLNSSSAHLTVDVQNFTLDPAGVDQAPVEGTGHYHIFVDGEYVAYNADTDYDITDLTAGKHTIMVELVGNDHQSLSPRVVDFLDVTVSASAPSIKIISPTKTSSLVEELNSSSIDMSVQVSNFKLSQAVNGDNVAGEGHYHVYVDGVYYSYETATSFRVTRLSAGPHVISVELVNNDHSSLTPPVVDSLSFTVTADRPGISILAPAAGKIGTSTTVTVSVENFTLDAANFGKSGVNMPHDGHFHVDVDGVYYIASAIDSVTISGLAPGDHLLQVELVNNDHTELIPAVWDQIKVTVSAPE